MQFLPSGLRAVIFLLESRTVNGGQWEKADFKASLPPPNPSPIPGTVASVGDSRVAQQGSVSWPKGSTFPCGSGVELPRSRGFCTAWADFLLRDGCSDPAQNNFSSFLALGLLLEARASGKEGKEGLLRLGFQGPGRAPAFAKRLLPPSRSGLSQRPNIPPLKHAFPIKRAFPG